MGSKDKPALPTGVGDGTTVPARSLAGFFAAAGTILLILVFIPHGGHFNDAFVVAGATTAFVVAAVVGALGRRIPNWALHPLLIGGTAVGSVVLLSGRGNPLVVASASFYIAVTMFAFRFFSRLVAVAYLGMVGAALGVVLGMTDKVNAGPGEWVLIMATAITVGVVITRVRAQLWRTAMTDSLTGLPNRPCLDFVLGRHVQRARRTSRALSVAMVDLDAFKALNDELGHAAGDVMLARIAGQWRRLLRRQDLLARYGGDEFVVVLPDTTLEGGTEVLDRLPRNGRVQLSVGIATLEPTDTVATLLARADANMYAAKRNRRRGSNEDLPDHQG